MNVLELVSEWYTGCIGVIEAGEQRENQLEAEAMECINKGRQTEETVRVIDTDK